MMRALALGLVVAVAACGSTPKLSQEELNARSDASIAMMPYMLGPAAAYLNIAQQPQAPAQQGVTCNTMGWQTRCY